MPIFWEHIFPAIIKKKVTLYNRPNPKTRAVWGRKFFFPLIIKLPVLKYSPDGACFVTYNYLVINPSIGFWYSNTKRWSDNEISILHVNIYLMTVHPPGVGKNFGFPGNAVAHSHAAGFVESFRWHLGLRWWHIFYNDWTSLLWPKERK